MNYIVMEAQTNGGISAIVPPVTYNDRNQAENQFHLQASSAAVSTVEVHTVMLITEDGRLVRPSETYRHPIPGPESEETEEETDEGV